MIAVSSTTITSSLARAVVPSAPPAGEGQAAPVDLSKPDLSVKTPAKAADKPDPKAHTGTPTKAEVATQVRELQAKMDKLNPSLAFVVDDASGRALIQLTDRATKEVIQQFPSEAALQISKALDRFQNGRIVNKIA